MLHLRFFASLRESLGIGKQELALPEGVFTVGELTAWLQQRDSAWRQALSGTHLTAINHQIARADATIADGDEIAWFPPVTGG